MCVVNVGCYFCDNMPYKLFVYFLLLLLLICCFFSAVFYCIYNAHNINIYGFLCKIITLYAQFLYDIDQMCCWCCRFIVKYYALPFIFFFFCYFQCLISCVVLSSFFSRSLILYLYWNFIEFHQPSFPEVKLICHMPLYYSSFPDLFKCMCVCYVVRSTQTSYKIYFHFNKPALKH